MAKTSMAKIEANRRNALKSTGPKTPAGREKSKRNALKHGLLSKSIVIETGDGKENREEYGSLLDQLHQDLRPQGALEEMLVERIAVCYWRLRRAVLAEIGETRKQLDNARFLKNTKIMATETIGFGETTVTFKGALKGLERLAQAKAEFEQTGNLSSETLFDLADALPSEVYREWSDLSHDISYKRDASAKEKARAFLLERISKRLNHFQRLIERFDEARQNEVTAHVASYHLPSEEVIDKILRYESTIERQLYRAIQELERLQQRRQGEITTLLFFALFAKRSQIAD